MDISEDELFSKCVDSYDQKEYQKAMEIADRITNNANFKTNSQFLALKGLILHCLDRKKEAYTNVRDAIKNAVSCSKCWHAYGWILLKDKKYHEAIKAFQAALTRKLVENRKQIMIDKSIAQISMRDLEGYKKTREEILKLSPTSSSKLYYAISNHLLCNFDESIKSLDSLRQEELLNAHTLASVSEISLYKNEILCEAEKFDTAVIHLKESSHHILDKIALKEAEGNICLKKGDFESAISIYEELIDGNRENVLYFRKYIEANQATNAEQIVALYKNLQCKFPESISLQMLVINGNENSCKYAYADYMLNANNIKNVEEIAGNKTIKKDNEMQWLWLQTENARAHQRLEQWDDALKICHEVDNHYSETILNGFSLKGVSLRKYVALLKLEDAFSHHQFYERQPNVVYIVRYDCLKQKPSDVEDFFDDAIKLLKTLQLLSSENIETHLLAFEIYFRKNDLKSALESIQCARSIDENNPKLHSCVIRFYKLLHSERNRSNLQSIDTTTLFHEKDADTLNALFLSKNLLSFDHILQAAKCAVELDRTKEAEVALLITQYDVAKLTLEQTTHAYETLCSFGTCKEQATKYKRNCQDRFNSRFGATHSADTENFIQLCVVVKDLAKENVVMREENRDVKLNINELQLKVNDQEVKINEQEVKINEQAVKIIEQAVKINQVESENTNMKQEISELKKANTIFEQKLKDIQKQISNFSKN